MTKFGGVNTVKIRVEQSLLALYQAGIISYDDALKYADSENEIRLMIKLSQSQPAENQKALSGVSVLKS